MNLEALTIDAGMIVTTHCSMSILGLNFLTDVCGAKEGRMKALFEYTECLRLYISAIEAAPFTLQ